MDTARIWPLCILLCAPLQAAADVAPPSLYSDANGKARAAAAAWTLATCSPSREEQPGPRGTLITYRFVEYDMMAGEVTVTPPEARTPLRAWVNRFYKAVRPCLPPAADLKSPERLPIKLSIFLLNSRVDSAIALAMDKRVDTKCVEAMVVKQEAPAISVATARLSVDLTLAPFCVITYELQRGNDLPEPHLTGFGSGRNRHLMPPAAPPR